MYLLYLSFKLSLIQRIYKSTFFLSKRKNTNVVLSSGNVYCGHGSFIILTSVFNSVNHKPLTYEPFLYGEELFLAELIREQGFLVYYDNKLIVNDFEHASTGNLPKKDYYLLNMKALKFIIKRFYL